MGRRVGIAKLDAMTDDFLPRRQPVKARTQLVIVVGIVAFVTAIVLTQLR